MATISMATVPHSSAGYEGEIEYLMPETSLRSKVARTRREYAQRYQGAFRQFGRAQSAAFFKQALIAYKVRFNQYWKDLGYESFDAWAATPEQGSSGTDANLQAQIIEVCVMFFRIPVIEFKTGRAPMYYVGIKKWTIIMPILAKLRKDVLEFDQRIARHESKTHSIDDDNWRWKLRRLIERREALFTRCRDAAISWIDKAVTTSASALIDDSDEHRGWKVLFSDTVKMETLRSCLTVGEVLDLLGINELTDDQFVRLNAKRRNQGKGK